MEPTQSPGTAIGLAGKLLLDILQIRQRHADSVVALLKIAVHGRLLGAGERLHGGLQGIAEEGTVIFGIGAHAKRRLPTVRAAADLFSGALGPAADLGAGSQNRPTTPEVPRGPLHAFFSKKFEVPVRRFA